MGITILNFGSVFIISSICNSIVFKVIRNNLYCWYLIIESGYDIVFYVFSTIFIISSNWNIFYF